MIYTFIVNKMYDVCFDLDTVWACLGVRDIKRFSNHLLRNHCTAYVSVLDGNACCNNVKGGERVQCKQM